MEDSNEDCHPYLSRPSVQFLLMTDEEEQGPVKGKEDNKKNRSKPLFPLMTKEDEEETLKNKVKDDDSKKTEPTCWTRYIKELKTRCLTLPTLLLALYNAPIIMCLIFLQSILYRLVSPPNTEPTSCFSTSGTSNDGLVIAVVLQYLLLYTAYPLTGWLADTKLGRGRVVLDSVKLCWFGMLLQVTSFCIQYGTCGWPISFAKYGLSVVALVLMTIGTAGYLANVLPYGMDLLVFESNAKIRSFIHWNIWSIFIGSSYNFGALLAVPSLNQPTLMMVTSFSTFFILSLAIVLNACLGHRFNKSFLKSNPYSTVYNVLSYAVKNKAPTQRSAFTYSEQKPPQRIDNGKHKYGGPFTQETVEDVKTFLRILTVLLALFGFYLAYPTVRDFLPTIMNQFRGGATDLNGFSGYLLWQVLDVLPAGLLIPLFELIIIPLFPKVDYFLMKPLRGLVLMHVLLLISVVSLFGISAGGYLTSTKDIPCYTIWKQNDPTISFPYYVLAGTAAISGFADNFSFLYAFEFICSQSPSNMVGMLIGLFWCLRGTFIQINYFMTLPLSYHPINGLLSCGFWVTLVPVILGSVGLVCFCLAIRWYRKRERDDIEDIEHHFRLEKHFEYVLDQEEKYILDLEKECFEERYMIIESDNLSI